MRLRGVLGWLLLLVVLGPAAMLTLTRVVEPLGGTWVRLESFTPFALPLYAVGLVALLVLLVRRRARVVAVLCVVVAAALGLHLWWYAPMLTGANPPPAADAASFRVMTANLYVGDADGIAVVQAAVDEDADVLVLEEISPELLATMEEAGLADAFPFRAGEPGTSAHGTMVFSRFELGEPTPVDTYWDSLAVPVTEPASGERLTLMAVHPHAPTDVDRWRHDQDAIRAAAGQLEPDLVVGDFNATDDHAPLRALADDGFRSVTELANDGWQPTWPADGIVSVLGIPVPSLLQIDHVLVGPALAAVGSHPVDLVGTDHRGLLAEVAPK